jgi:CspA family cold shock protein
MRYSVFFAVVTIAATLAFIAWLIGISAWMPLPLAFFSVAMLAGLLTSLLCHKAPVAENSIREAAGSRPAKSGKERGQVKWFSSRKGFGFITRPNGEEIFVHFRSINGNGHRILKEGQQVEFFVGRNDKGLQAEDVIALN